MTEELTNEVLDQLRKGEIQEYRVEKDVSPIFRLVFPGSRGYEGLQGNAQRHRAIVYMYEPGWTA